MVQFDEKYFLAQLQNLLNIDSTTGQFRAIQNYIEDELDRLGFSYTETHKGGVIADFGGEGNALLITAHVDDIGLMVRHINADGTLNVTPIGGLYPFYCVTENVRIYTHSGKVITGSICRNPNSIHVTEEELRDTAPDYRKNVCVVIDAPVKSADAVRALGIETGDFIALEPRFRMENGYIKSRFIDDKAAVAIKLAAMKYIKDNGIVLSRKVYAYFAMYEEIGHGTTFMPEDVKDYLAIDIAPTGPDQNSDETKVTIFCADTRFPYHAELTNELHDIAEKAGVDYVMDIFTPHYGTDGDASVAAGYDIRHAAIGFGTLNSHGYERTHIDGIRNTYKLLLAYLLK